MPFFLLFLVVTLMNACQTGGKDESPSLYCNDESITGLVDNTFKDSPKKGCPENPGSSSGKALFNFKPKPLKDPKIVAWESDPSVLYILETKWPDRSGSFRLVVFRDLAKDCLKLESIRESSGEALIYSKKLCSFTYADKNLSFDSTMSLPKDRVQWRQDSKCENCDRTSLHFDLTAKNTSLLASAMTCSILKVSDSDMKIECRAPMKK